MPSVDVLPSLLSADFAYLARDLERCTSAGATHLHVDVMDGHFVPNITFGPGLVACLRSHTQAHLDVHLMLSDPVRYVQDFRAAGADAITIHVEAVGQRSMQAAIKAVRASGAQVGLSFNPDTDPELWWRWFDQVDLVMFMTVYPGFGGQTFIPQVRRAIRRTRARFAQLAIQVDGGIARDTIPLVTADGANRLVCGSAFFREDNPAQFLRWARSLPCGAGQAE